MSRVNRKLQLVILLVLVCLVGTMSIAYAVLSTSLNINGTAQVQDASWNVHFSNIQVNPYSVEINPVITDNNKITFSADLTTPGDFYKFTVDIVNEGSIDAMIESIAKVPELTTEQKKYLRYEVEYVDGTSINDSQLLKSGETKTISVLFSYRNDIPTSDLPTTENNFDLEIMLVYAQADSTGVEIPNNQDEYNITYVGIDSSEHLLKKKDGNNLVIKFHNTFNNIKIKNGETYLAEDKYIFDGDNLTIYDSPTDLTIINVDAIQIIPDFDFSNDEYTITMGGWNTYRANSRDLQHEYNLYMSGSYDISDMNYVEFDLYIPSGYDPTMLTYVQHQFEISSSGICDVDEFSSIFLREIYGELISGQWNHVVLPFSTFGGYCDKTKINYIGIYWNNSGSGNDYEIPNCKIKNFKFSNYLL